MINRILFTTCVLIVLCLENSYAQEVPVYPKVTGYFSVIHPIVTFYPTETVTNFSDNYVVGFPTGINLIKSDRIGFSFELTPFIKSEKNTSKVYNVLFHPGVLFRFKKGFGITTRAAFETSGRYGFTAIFSKVVVKGKTANLFAAIPFPVRFGNDLPNSAGMGLQVGVSF